MKFKEFTFDNGLRLVVVPLKGSLSTTVLTLAGVGSHNETKKVSGLSHFLEHMCFKGTEKRAKSSDITRELDAIGAQYNAFTGYEYTGYYAKAHPKYFSKILDVVSDIYLHSKLAQDEMEKERGVIIEEINMYNDEPQSKVSQILSEMLYGDQPAGRDIAGTVTSVSKFVAEDFRKHHSTYYGAPNTVVVVAGDVNVSETKKEIERSFKSISTKKAPRMQKTVEKQSKPAVVVKTTDTDQTHLILGFRSLKLGHKDERVLRVLRAVLSGGMSSRLFERIREEMGAAYYIRANSSNFKDFGVFSISAGIAASRLEEVVSALLDEVRRLRDEKVSPEELKKTKDLIAGRTFLRFESSDSFANAYGLSVVSGEPLKTPQEEIRELRKVTAEDIQRVARKIFVDNNLNLAVLGPVKKTRKLTNLLHI
jgi:predicted Zn-dependent peptidase